MRDTERLRKEAGQLSADAAKANRQGKSELAERLQARAAQRRAGTPKPDVSTVEAIKQLLLKAKTVAVPGSTSGIWLRTDLFPRLGIVEKINVKATPRGTYATQMVAEGSADLAIMPVSEILHATGVDFAGRPPPEIQFVQVFSAAVVAGSGDIEGAKRLIEFLASAGASGTIRKSGMEPLAASG